jgi:hypothetical protein
MKLTGKCKEDFEKQSINNQLIKFKKILGLFCVNIYGFWVPFYLLPESMQYAVHVDFFDSVGIYPLVIPTINAYWTFKIIKTIPVNLIETPPYKNVDASDYQTLSEARTAAIEKANEIYNK